MSDHDSQHISVFLKENKSGQDRERIFFKKIAEECPELARRTVLIRSRVKLLKKNFRRDSKWAEIRFSFATIFTLLISAILIMSGLYFQAHDSNIQVTQTNIAIGVLVGVVGAAVSAFGWNRRFHALVRARWAMASLELRIDNFLHNVALDVEGKKELSEEHRVYLRKEILEWLQQIDATLSAFGDAYGQSLSSMKTGTKELLTKNKIE